MGSSAVVLRSAAGMVAVIAILLTGCSTPSAGHEGNQHPPSGTTSHARMVSEQYLNIARSGNERLEKVIDALTGLDRNRLSASVVDLRDASATERLFDRRLSAVVFPPAIRVIAQNLYSVNEARAAVTAEATQSKSLSQLRSHEVRISGENEHVEVQVRRIRRALHLPPPETI